MIKEKDKKQVVYVQCDKCKNKMNLSKMKLQTKLITLNNESNVEVLYWRCKNCGQIYLVVVKTAKMKEFLNTYDKALDQLKISRIKNSVDIDKKLYNANIIKRAMDEYQHSLKDQYSDEIIKLL
jgi:uncharacterized Zn finger protein